MTESTIYSDIAKRTGGDIYIGVVGPVRTGKSTFIKKFLESSVIPNIDDENDRARTLDEVPQSASGITVMTTEPKFIPGESVKVNLDSGVEFRVKMIDCVGYMVDGALGTLEDGEPRMVMTPWSEEPMPFEKSAELGTRKVIEEHSTIGVLVTTDGTITDIPRESYETAEERVALELRAAGKPFAIILNSKKPGSEKARELAETLEKKYCAPVALVNCLSLTREDIREILALILGQFPVSTLSFTLPAWCEALPPQHSLYRSLLDKIDGFCERVTRLGDIPDALTAEGGIVQTSVSAGDGVGSFELPVSTEDYYAVINELTGLNITDEKCLFEELLSLSDIKNRYSKYENAISDLQRSGYGIVMPGADELSLEEPTLSKTPGGYGVKVCAHASSVHMIKAGLRADLCPVVGTKEQAEEVVRYLQSEYEACPERIWESNMFGKSLYDLVNDDMKAKLMNMPDESRDKFGETLERIINEGASGLVCILL